MTRPSIKCSSHLQLITIRGGTQQVKRPIPILVRKNLQPRAIQTQPLITIRGETPQNKRKPYQMGDKTFNQVEIKPEIILCHFTLYKTTTVLLLHQQGLASYVFFIWPQVQSVAKTKATNIHTHTYKTNNSKFVIKGKLVH